MSMFFFRLHNLRREEEKNKKRKIEQRQRRGAKVFRRVSNDFHQLTAPSRLFERTPMNPSDSMDSLDQINLKIPRSDADGCWMIYNFRISIGSKIQIPHQCLSIFAVTRSIVFINNFFFVGTFICTKSLSICSIQIRDKDECDDREREKSIWENIWIFK